MNYTYNQLIEDIKKIAGTYIGKTDKLAYRHIREDIEKHIETLEYVSELRADAGVVLIDTTEEEFIGAASNIGEKTIISYHIDWVPDKRSINKPSSKVKDITVSAELPDEFLELSIVDIPQVVHYMLAREHRARLLSQIEELEKELDSCKEGVLKFEKIMKTESFNSDMLKKDLKE